MAAVPFSERYTGDAIDEKTRKACIDAGVPHDMLSGVVFPVSDNGANMVKGWSGFGCGPCCVHTGQLSVKVYLDHPEIKPTRDKEKGMVSFFSQSTGVDGLGAFNHCQRGSERRSFPSTSSSKTATHAGADRMAKWSFSGCSSGRCSSLT